MFLGIEIGGTKLQVGAGEGKAAELVALERADVNAARGAAGILEQIERAAAGVMQRMKIERIGIGFGGPVDARAGKAIKSHQVAGWDDFPLAAWCEARFGIPAVIGNDCDAAALAEAKFGAGRGAGSMFYVTVGTGVGGGFYADGRLFGGGRPAIAEIGHLRPGLHADSPEATVESLASGSGIAAAARARIEGDVSRSIQDWQRRGRQRRTVGFAQQIAVADEVDDEFKRDLLDRAGGDLERITAKIVAQAATEGNELAAEVLDHGVRVLGWAVAQMITLLAPEKIVVGGGVSLIGEELFFEPLREYVDRYVFPPLADSFSIVPAALGDEVVVHGAVALAAGGR